VIVRRIEPTQTKGQQELDRSFLLRQQKIEERCPGARRVMAIVSSP
jgi:hypothetical protein